MDAPQKEKRLVIVFIRDNGVVENEQEEDQNHSKSGNKNSSTQFLKPRFPENVMILTRHIINQQPKQGYQNQPGDQFFIQ